MVVELIECGDMRIKKPTAKCQRLGVGWFWIGFLSTRFHLVFFDFSDHLPALSTLALRRLFVIAVTLHIAR